MQNKAVGNKIKELYLKNKTYNEISTILDIRKEEILRFVKKNNLCNERKSRNIRIIKEGLEKKKSREEIAEELCVTPNKVSNLAGNYKISTFFKKITFEKKEKLVLELYEQKPRSICKMASTTGFLYSFCKEIYQKNNLKNAITYTKKYKKLSENEYEEILIEIKKKEKTLAQIGREHNVSRQWIAHLKNKL